MGTWPTRVRSIPSFSCDSRCRMTLRSSSTAPRSSSLSVKESSNSSSASMSSCSCEERGGKKLKFFCMTDFKTRQSHRALTENCNKHDTDNLSSLPVLPRRSCRTRGCWAPSGSPPAGPHLSRSCPESCCHSSGCRAVWAPATQWWVLQWTGSAQVQVQRYSWSYPFLPPDRGPPTCTGSAKLGPPFTARRPAIALQLTGQSFCSSESCRRPKECNPTPPWRQVSGYSGSIPHPDWLNPLSMASPPSAPFKSTYSRGQI